LLTRMSWSCPTVILGFGLQCALYICCNVASCLGIMVCSWAFCQPFPQLPSYCMGLFPLNSWLLSWGYFCNCLLLQLYILMYIATYAYGTKLRPTFLLFSSQKKNPQLCDVIT
jgi:hypothetical protein